MVWVPRGVDLASREVLIDGVPAHLKPALLEWIKSRVTVYYPMTGSRIFNADVLRAYDVVARPAELYANRGRDWPGFIVRLSDDEMLDLVDWLAHDDPDSWSELTTLLEGSSSAWALGRRNGNVGLVRRVTQSVQTAADNAMSQGSAGALLGEAWSACFGRGPNPEEAYEKAIKAVEEAAAPVVSPKNLKATLGTMIRDMKAQGDWKLDLPGTAQDVPVVLMEALWTGQESRHGGNGYRVPTQSEGEAAVLSAVPLVQWFASGAVARRP